ncbi:MAG: YbhN family protein [Candidatus Nomurabacteria bacterium]|nr:YbhN family protein [Candidatus Nomurabacteria bacterium]
MEKVIKKRHWGKIILNSAVAVFVILLIYFARDDIAKVGEMLGQINIWVLLLLIPAQIFSYFSGGMTIFSYLKGRQQLKDIKMTEVTAMSLELNFMNHVFPSGGISGITYMVWRLKKLGIAGGQATMAQMIRFLAITVAFVVLLAVSLLAVTIDNKSDNWLVLVAAFVVSGVAFLIIFAAYVIGSKKRVISFSHWISRLSNKVVQKITLGKFKKSILPLEKSEKFFLEIYEDFLALKEQKKLLIKPIAWGFAFVIADVALFAVAFLALGVDFNPALLVIAYGAASVMGMIMITPGGAGGYEAVMVMVLAAGGMATAGATSGVILARVILIFITLATGYVVYHRAMAKYGKPVMKQNVDILNVSGK